MRSIEMERIPHRELRNNSSEILRRVAAGESFEITNHGEVVAEIGPPRHDLGGLPVVKPATRRRDWSGIPRFKPTRPTQEILDELREDRI
jgi:antitoxin (DNA-binding transcriptional repressor) of toxin-antitoxin stability system